LCQVGDLTYPRLVLLREDFAFSALKIEFPSDACGLCPGTGTSFPHRARVPRLATSIRMSLRVSFVTCIRFLHPVPGRRPGLPQAMAGIGATEVRRSR
jgi:hypothetical protein